MNNRTEYIAIEPTREENNLEIHIGYEKGGINWYNGQNNKRGYYLYCTPCQKNIRTLDNGQSYSTISTILGKGVKMLLIEVSRQSKKAEETATAKAEAEKNTLVCEVLNRYNLKLL